MFTFLKRLFILAALALSIYSGYKYAMPYYRYYAFRTDAQDIIRFRVRSADVMKAKLYQKALDVGIPISEKGITVEEMDGGYWGTVRWSEEVNILDRHRKVLRFEVELEP